MIDQGEDRSEIGRYPDKPLVGISACLAGEAVRYDAGDKHQPLLLERLSPHLELSPFCPEVAAGLGIPRPPVQLVRSTSGEIRAQGLQDPALDVTGALSAAADDYSHTQLEPLSGFIFKSRSPSCGLGSTPLKNRGGDVFRRTDGVFARQIRRAAPWLPCVEEGWLQSSEHCHRFLSACWVVARDRHGNSNHRELIRLLEAEPELRNASATALVEFLLLPSGEAGNEKAALWGRLTEYWQRQY